MNQNPNLCQHNWQFAHIITSAGTYKPKIKTILYCSKCAKIKVQEIKD